MGWSSGSFPRGDVIGGSQVLRRVGAAPGGSAPAARRGTLRRRHQAAGDAARGVRPQPSRARPHSRDPGRCRAASAGRRARLHVRGSRALADAAAALRRRPARARGAGRRDDEAGAPAAMCRDTVRHVGEIVAMVLAPSRALAEDACELVEVDYELLPPVTDMVAAAEAGRAAGPRRVGHQRGGRVRDGLRRRRRGACGGRRDESGSASTSSATSACPSRRAAWSLDGMRATGA